MYLFVLFLRILRVEWLWEKGGPEGRKTFRLKWLLNGYLMVNRVSSAVTR